MDARTLALNIVSARLLSLDQRPIGVILYVNVALYALFGHMNIHNPRSVLIAVHLCMIAEGIINHVDVDKLDTPQLSPHS
ncbi:hypothetical protein WN943_020336 [Citrus x changshan-huyou]